MMLFLDCHCLWHIFLECCAIVRAGVQGLEAQAWLASGVVAGKQMKKSVSGLITFPSPTCQAFKRMVMNLHLLPPLAVKELPTVTKTKPARVAHMETIHIHKNLQFGATSPAAIAHVSCKQRKTMSSVSLEIPFIHPQKSMVTHFQ